MGWVGCFEDQQKLFLALFMPSMGTHICECTNKSLLDDVLKMTNGEMIGYMGILIILGVI